MSNRYYNLNHTLAKLMFKIFLTRLYENIIFKDTNKHKIINHITCIYFHLFTPKDSP